LSQAADDFLRKLAQTAWASVKSGYYDDVAVDAGLLSVRRSLRHAVEANRGKAIIAEIKYASPLTGSLRNHADDPAELAKRMVVGGAVALSVLTEPKLFNGSLHTFRMVRKSVNVPLLMKDIIVSHVQVDAAAKMGADAVLLIMGLFNQRLCEIPISDMISLAHQKGLEVLLETHTAEEFRAALETDADLVGINNRDLSTLDTNLETSVRLLSSCKPPTIPVVSESGISSPSDIRLLRAAGADGFLIGTSIMQAADVEAKVRELAQA